MKYLCMVGIVALFGVLLVNSLPDPSTVDNKTYISDIPEVRIEPINGWYYRLTDTSTGAVCYGLRRSTGNSMSCIKIGSTKLDN